MPRQFRQVDVFTDTPYLGNPLAVVLGAEGLSDEQMRQFANWTNLSETTFVLPPRASEADYLVRIFTPGSELPFAGHPTLGTCHAWLEAGGRPARAGQAVQECGAGLVTIKQTETGLAFAAPPLLRQGPVEEEVAERVAKALNIGRTDIVDIQWADNGPGWVAVLLDSAEAVLAIQPGTVSMDIGVAGLYPPGSPEALEVRAFSGPGQHGRGPGHGQPERLAGPVAARHRPPPGPLRGQSGHGHGPPRPGAHLPGRRRPGLGGRQRRHLHQRHGGDLVPARLPRTGSAAPYRPPGLSLPAAWPA